MPYIMLEDLQDGVHLWTTKNFGPPASRNKLHPVLGVAEEAGELCHAALKMDQGIRGTTEEHLEKMKDALGDIVIYMADVCNTYGFRLSDCIEETWEKVERRNWADDPKGGGA